jgi:spore germination protein YaaH/chitodextrinase
MDLPSQRSRTPRRLLVAVSAGLAALSLVPVSALAVRRPQGPHLVLPAAASTARSSVVRFHWQRSPRAIGYDLRLARNRSFTAGVETIAVHGTSAKTTLARGAWYWRVRSHGRIASRWSNTRMLRVRPSKDVFPPTRPGALRVTAETATTATLSFTASKDDVAVARYDVLANGDRIATATSASPTVEGLACGTLYTFTVVARDAAGNGSRPSPPAHMRTRTCATTAPAVPASPLAIPVGLTARTVTDTTIALTWSGGGGAVGFAVYRNGVLLGKPTSPGFLATSLGAATAYTFTVRARDGAGNLTADSAPISVTTLPPIPSTGDAYAFLLATVDSSCRDLQAHYTQIGTIAPTYFEVLTNGVIGGQDDPLVTHWAQLHGVAVEPRFHSEDPAVIHGLLTDPTAANALAEKIAALCAQYGYDGANLDFEGAPATDRAALTAFARTLAGLLHDQGERLTVSVGAKTGPVTTGRNGFWDYVGLSQAADRLFVMAWDLHWSRSAPGPISDVTWVRKVVTYVKTVPNAGENFVLGTQLYGFDWPPAGGVATALEYTGIQALIAQFGATPGWDPVAQEPTFQYAYPGGGTHTVYWANAASVDARYAVARSAGIGIGMWRLGSEDQTMWNDPTIQP